MSKRMEYFEASDGTWSFRDVARNGKITISGHGYNTKNAAIKARGDVMVQAYKDLHQVKDVYGYIIAGLIDKDKADCIRQWVRLNMVEAK